MEDHLKDVVDHLEDVVDHLEDMVDHLEDVVNHLEYVDDHFFLANFLVHSLALASAAFLFVFQ